MNRHLLDSYGPIRTMFSRVASYLSPLASWQLQSPQKRGEKEKNETKVPTPPPLPLLLLPPVGCIRIAARTHTRAHTRAHTHNKTINTWSDVLTIGG